MNQILQDALSQAEDGDDMEKIGKGILLAFFAYIAQERNKAYHQGMRDGMILKKSSVQISERLRLMDLPIDDLELSVRSGNVLRMAGITSMEQFLALDRNTVMRLPNAGTKTWREIEEVQRYVRGDV